ncbi:MAG: preprotein translocase subunit SecG [Candidatus Cloacimonetes bacterium]|nr:preprotein translocase subunit SecG [Candidatus Cloacimonadota bacterium]
MFILLMVLHVIISIALVVIILAQTSKGDAVGGMLGGVATSTFGSQGASEFLRKWTKILATVWMAMTLIIALSINTAKVKKSSVMESIKEQTSTQTSQTVPVSDLNQVEGTENVIPTEKPAETTEPVQETESTK